MPTNYKVGGLNPTLMPGASDVSPFAGGQGEAPGGIGRDSIPSDLTLWAREMTARVQAGDPAALAEIERMVQPDRAKINDNKKNMARKISNEILGTQYLTPYEKSTVFQDMLPGIMMAGGALGAGLLLPAAAGGAGAATASGFGTAGMAGATGAAGLLPAAGGLGAAGAGAAGSAGGGGGGLGGLGAGAAGSAGGAGGAAGAAGGSGGLLSAGGASGLLGGLKKAAPLILGGLGAVQSANQYGQANDLRQQAIDMAKQDYAGRAPLRDAFTAGALKPLPQRPDLSGMLRTTNPYQNPVPR